jgi:polyphosphate kinase
VLAPVRDPALRARIDELLEVLVADDVLAWHLTADGTWQPPSGRGTLNAQARLEELALARVRRIAAV